MNKRPSFPTRLDFSPAKPSASRASLQPVRAAPGTRAKAPLGAPPHGFGLDSSAIRRTMVQRLAGLGITNASVLAAMQTIERHRFVDSALVNQTYEETSLPIGLGQTISKPAVVARMLELLCQGAQAKLGRVLEIGTGCGYQAALLGLLAQEVYSMERVRGLHERARDNLRHLRMANLHLLFGDGMAGYPRGAPYAGVIAAAGGHEVPSAWTDQLAIGGRLVAPVSAGAGAAAQQALVVIDKTAQGLRRTVLEAVHFVPLKSGLA